MAIAQSTLENKIKDAFPEANFKVIDLMGDQDHYALEIEDEAFRGKSRIQQHKLVNQALKDCLGTELHALTIKTSIPA